MMTDEGFNALVEEIIALGYDDETAASYAARIGDLPIRDENGQILIVQHSTGAILDRLTLKSFNSLK